MSMNYKAQILNKTPLWKIALILLFIAFCGLYATPNLYGEDPAVQISAGRNAVVDANTLDSVRAAIQGANLTSNSEVLQDGQILVRLPDNNTQLQAQKLLEETLGEDYNVAINLAPLTPSWLEAIGAGPMKLGLDLRGGVHFLMEVDMDSAIKENVSSMASNFKSQLREENIRYRSVKERAAAVDITFRDEETLAEAEFFLKRNYPNWVFREQDGLKIIATMSEQKLQSTKSDAISQNITIIRNRVNQLGVAEPVVQRQGAERIVVQLPGIQDTARAKQILNATATLALHLVDQNHDPRDAVNGRVPAGTILVKDENDIPYLLKKQIMLKGNHIVDANSGVDEYGRPQVSINVDSEGGSKMSRGTKRNIGKPMATVFVEYKPLREKTPEGKIAFERRERIISVATIQAQLGSSFRITGLDSPQEARNLALLLRAGALIAPIQIVEERTVGPSLGQQNIDQGTSAIIWGFCLVLGFMVVYYRGFGLVANAALAVNLIMIVGIMSMIPGATLTLPGMAGIVLTVGMAVDANVLIFERIREELREGRSPQQSIHYGYDSAFSTILDANITTLIAALILFAVGTGPIKGFSVTLMIGIMTSMFTAIIFTRAIVNSVWGGKRLKKLPI